MLSEDNDDDAPKPQPGTALLGANAAPAAKPVDPDSPNVISHNLNEPEATERGTNVFGAEMLARLDVPGSADALVVDPRQEAVIGRRDPATGIVPDVDLTVYAGYKLGVSRKHAIMRVRGERLEILDLGSSNGTCINGTRITAHEPRILHDGDQLTFGKLAMYIHFQTKTPLE